MQMDADGFRWMQMDTDRCTPMHIDTDACTWMQCEGIKREKWCVTLGEHGDPLGAMSTCGAT